MDAKHPDGSRKDTGGANAAPSVVVSAYSQSLSDAPAAAAEACDPTVSTQTSGGQKIDIQGPPTSLTAGNLQPISVDEDEDEGFIQRQRTPSKDLALGIATVPDADASSGTSDTRSARSEAKPRNNSGDSSVAETKTATNNSSNNDTRGDSNRNDGREKANKDSPSAGPPPLTRQRNRNKSKSPSAQAKSGSTTATSSSAPKKRAHKNSAHRLKHMKIVCCGRGDDAKLARKIFSEIDVNGGNRISWDEFLYFVRHSYDHYAVLVLAADQATDPVVRFRQTILEAVVGKKELHKDSEVSSKDAIQDEVMTVLFNKSRSFEGRGLVTKARRVFRGLDDNDSGAISFDEFLEALHQRSFFDSNVTVHNKKLLLVERALWCCDTKNPCRRAAIFVAYSQTFENLLIVVIVLNTLVIAVEDYSDPNLGQGDPSDFTITNQFVFYSDFVFTGLYAIEFLVKVVASGFAFGRGVYLSSWWNVFDFAILVFSIVWIVFEYAVDEPAEEQELSEFLKVLRVFRIMRPLKSISAVPHMRRLASTVVAAVNALKEIIFLLVLLWLLFGIILVDLLHGDMSRRCHAQTEAELIAGLILDDGRNASSVLANGTDAQLELDLASVWPTTDLSRACGSVHTCFREQPCPPNETECLAPQLCLSVRDLVNITAVLPEAAANTFVWQNDVFAYNERMNFGITNFDNLGFALISLFQISTLEGWVDIVYIVQDSFGDYAAFWIFFVVMMVCGVLMIGLILAVIESVHTFESERMLDAKVEDWSTPSTNVASMRGMVAVVRSMRSGGLRRWVNSIRAKLARRAQRRQVMLSVIQGDPRARTASKLIRRQSSRFRLASRSNSKSSLDAPESGDQVIELVDFRNPAKAKRSRRPPPLSETETRLMQLVDDAKKQETAVRMVEVSSDDDLEAGRTGLRHSNTVTSTTLLHDLEAPGGSSRDSTSTSILTTTTATAEAKAGTAGQADATADFLEEDDSEDFGERRAAQLHCFLKVVNFVQSKQVTAVMSVCVALNLAFMCAGVYEPSQYWTCRERADNSTSDALCNEADRDFIICVSNYVFVAVFLVEMLFRWATLLGALCKSGTCSGTHWATIQEEKEIDKLREKGLLTLTDSPVPSKDEKRKRPVAASEQGAGTHAAKPIMRRQQSENTLLNTRRCTGRCRPNISHDASDAVTQLLFDAAQIRKLDYLDATVTIIAVIDLYLADECTRIPRNSLEQNETNLVALRALSLLRVVRLFASWKTMQALLQIIYESATELLSFLVLMLIFVYMSSLLGLQLFSNRFHFDADGYYVKWEPLVYNHTCPPHAPWTPEKPYSRELSNFDTFGDAVLTTFQIWSGEDWNVVMYFAIRSGGPVLGPVYFLYFVFAIFAGNWILLNLLIAIMLGHFELSKIPTAGVKRKNADDDGDGDAEDSKKAADSGTLGSQVQKLFRRLSSHERNRERDTETVHPKHTVQGLLASSPRKKGTRMLSIKLSMLTQGPAHQVLDNVRIGGDGLLVRRHDSEVTHRSLGLMLHDQSARNLLSHTPSVSTDDGRREDEQAEEARSDDMVTSVEPPASHEAPQKRDSEDRSSTSAHKTPPGPSRSSSAGLDEAKVQVHDVGDEDEDDFGHDHVLGGETMVHVAKHRRWKKEATGALVIDLSVRRLKHCCPDRVCLFNLLESPVYGYTRSALAILVTFVYIAYTPMEPNNVGTNVYCGYFFIFTAGFFALEIVVQMVTLGSAYFKIPWSYVNICATALLALGCLGMYSDGVLQVLQVCRCGLTFYIFQVLSRLPLIRVTFAAIIKSLPKVLEITLIVVFFMVTFSIIFVTEYKGKLGHCDLDTVNATGLQILEEKFGLTDGVIYYQYVLLGQERATNSCQYTNDAELAPQDQVRWTRQDCVDYGGTWKNEFPNFDNFGNSLIALFHLATTEGWIDIMHRCVSAVGQDTHPMVGYSPWRGLAFGLYILVVAIFLSQLFATALVANFELLSEQESGMGALTKTQQEWLATAHSIATLDLRRKATEPRNNRCRLYFFRLARHKAFTVINQIMVAVYLCLCIGGALFPEDDELIAILVKIQAAAVAYFCGEVIIKLMGFGRRYLVRWEQRIGHNSRRVASTAVPQDEASVELPNAEGSVGDSSDSEEEAKPTNDEVAASYGHGCFRMRRRYIHTMNTVELCGVIFCVVSLALDFSDLDKSAHRQESFHVAALVFRVLRLTRVMTLLRAMQTIRQYLVTLGHSVIAVANIVILFFVLVNTFALTMREFFHFVEVRPDSIGGLEPHAHFQKWVTSFSLMTRSTTGEAWHKIFYDLIADTEDCRDVFSLTAESVAEYQANLTFEEASHLSYGTDFGGLATNGCGLPGAVFPLFIFFIYLSAFVMMNVFLAVVLEAFGAQASEQTGLVPGLAFAKFVNEWRKVDTDFDLFVDASQVMTILTRSPAPFGIGVVIGTRNATPAAKKLEELSSQKLISNVLRTKFGHLNISLFEGKVYFYDICAELLRVYAVEKARERNENYGLFFQSREAIGKLNAMDAILHRKLRDKWYCDLKYEYTLRQGIACVVIQKLARGYLHRGRKRKKQ